MVGTQTLLGVRMSQTTQSTTDYAASNYAPGLLGKTNKKQTKKGLLEVMLILYNWKKTVCSDKICALNIELQTRFPSGLFVRHFV